MTNNSKLVRAYEKRIKDAGGCKVSIILRHDVAEALKKLCETNNMSKALVINRLIKNGHLLGNL
jgi:L-cysteine desulfidase